MVSEMREGNFNRVERAERVEKGLGVSSQELDLAAKNAKGAKPWPMVRLGDVCETISTRGHQIKQAEIKQVGRYPVVTQSENEIEGFTDDNICINDVPIVLFGDHTCVVKAVGEPFVVGADGTKLLKPRGVDFEYLVFVVKKVASGLVDGKYRRHYSDLVESVIPLPPLSVQKEIVERLEKELGEADKVAAEFKRMAELADKEFKAELDETFVVLREKGSGVSSQELVSGEVIAHAKSAKFAKSDVGNVLTQRHRGTESWPMVRLGDVCEFMRRGKSPIYCDISPYPMFAQKCNQPTHITLEKCKFCIPSKYLKFSEEYQLRENDIVVNSTGTGTLGRVGLFRMSYLEPYGYKSIVADSHVMIVRPAKIAFSVYVYWYMKQDWVYKWINDNANGSTNQKELYPQTLAQLSIPLPPIEVQKEIVAKLDAAKERCEKLKAEAERGLRAAENLRKAILSEAFEL